MKNEIRKTENKKTNHTFHTTAKLILKIHILLLLKTIIIRDVIKAVKRC